jgi:hypothetical protein
LAPARLTLDSLSLKGRKHHLIPPNQGDSYSIDFSVVSRQQGTLDSHIVIRKEDKGYSTTSHGAIYKRSVSLSALSVDGDSALSNGPVAYRDTCTSSGCDHKQREYLSGSAAYLIQVDSIFISLLANADLKDTKQCRFRATGDVENSRIINTGHIVLGSTSYKAVKSTSIETGEIYCDAYTPGELSRDDVFMGKGQQTRSEIVIADSLPHVEMELNGGSQVAFSCPRTIVGQTSFIKGDNGQLYKGEAREIVSAKIDGDIISVDQYSKDRADRASLIQHLQDAVTLAQFEMQSADYEADAEDVKAREARMLANQTGAETEAKLADEAEAAARSKRELAAQAHRRYSDAVDSLAQVKAQMTNE